VLSRRERTTQAPRKILPTIVQYMGSVNSRADGKNGEDSRAEGVFGAYEMDARRPYPDGVREIPNMIGAGQSWVAIALTLTSQSSQDALRQGARFGPSAKSADAEDH